MCIVARHVAAVYGRECGTECGGVRWHAAACVGAEGRHTSAGGSTSGGGGGGGGGGGDSDIPTGSSHLAASTLVKYKG